MKAQTAFKRLTKAGYLITQVENTNFYKARKKGKDTVEFLVDTAGTVGSMKLLFENGETMYLRKLTHIGV